MSNSSRSDSDNSFDEEELLQIETRCKELRKEREMLRESQSQSFELIRILELNVKSLSEARTGDKRHVRKLEKELMNCSQEIDYLQDQLNARNTEVNYLEEHVHSLKLRLEEMQNLQGEVDRLRKELQMSNSEQLLLIQELENKEVELRKSTLCIEKLEESISSIALESQCEVESIKLDMTALEQSCFDSKKTQEKTAQERARMNRLIQELQVQVDDAQKIINSLNEENRGLREKLSTTKMNATVFSQMVEEWLENMDRLQLNGQSSLSQLESNPTISEDMSACGEVLGPLLSKLATVLEPDADVRVKMEKMLCQMQEYELLVKQLKEELKEEKLKAKEEAEDLAQEMAELRYQITGLLEEECKRRACIEHASLQRIGELEEQLLREQRRTLVAARHLHEA
ncbi:Myosin heavy chain-related, putative isoform 1 [Quillaja saponaria]|uniref:Myosin heavy chain-related, putative isoform 1 n=1 Tax=Quillaja saponaria TaxID=32244 RepID=A0AAD7QBK5_QUISA|nr:Myosin heavy chain-related, putative isoform 1 [Quillaja saponaria]